MIRATVVLAFVGVAVLSAQSPRPVGPEPAFEVASVRHNRTGNQADLFLHSGPTGIAATYVTVAMLINHAYGFRRDRILGGPEWLDSERFDINARSSSDASDPEIASMLRSLLSERFKLVVRMENREQPVYALVLARSDGRLGPNLRPTGDCVGGTVSAVTPSPGGAPNRLSPQLPCGLRRFYDVNLTTISGGARTMDDLARALDGVGGRAVMNRTGLTGTFDFDLRYAPASAVASGTSNIDLADVFTAVQEQLGLKLDSQRGQVEFLVIDSVEMPTPN